MYRPVAMHDAVQEVIREPDYGFDLQWKFERNRPTRLLLFDWHVVLLHLRFRKGRPPHQRRYTPSPTTLLVLQTYS